eukprot:scaffold23460_cov113-Cylindrotheca_fusiformis.AAC.1
MWPPEDATDHDQVRLLSFTRSWANVSEVPEPTMIDDLISFLGHHDGKKWTVRPSGLFATEIDEIGSSATRSG